MLHFNIKKNLKNTIKTVIPFLVVLRSFQYFLLSLAVKFLVKWCWNSPGFGLGLECDICSSCLAGGRRKNNKKQQKKNNNPSSRDHYLGAAPSHCTKRKSLYNLMSLWHWAIFVLASTLNWSCAILLTLQVVVKYYNIINL